MRPGVQVPGLRPILEFKDELANDVCLISPLYWCSTASTAALRDDQAHFEVGQFLVHGVSERVGAVSLAPHQPPGDHPHPLGGGDSHCRLEVALNERPALALPKERHTKSGLPRRDIALRDLY